MTRLWTAGACVIVFAWAASGVAAQPKKAKGPRVIQLEEIRIEGRVQKPNAFYILNRSNIGYEVLDLRTSFVKEVVRGARTKHF